jgi:hypothetical protein
LYSTLRARHVRGLDARGGGSFSALAVLLLLAATYAVALTGPGSPFVDDPVYRDLHRALEGVRDIVAEVLDHATWEAVERAARSPCLDVATTLDACLVAGLARRFPLAIDGWEASLLEAYGGLEASPDTSTEAGEASGTWHSEGRALVSIAWEGSSDAFRVEVVADGPPVSPNLIAARAEGLLASLRDPVGPIAYSLKASLWNTLQGRALAVARTRAALIAEDEVRMALTAALSSVAQGCLTPVPRPPEFDLSGLVRQSVEGMLESHVGWIDDYLFLGDGLRGFLSEGEGTLADLPMDLLEGLWGLEARLRALAAKAVEGIVTGVLGRAMEDVPPPPVTTNLSDAFEEGYRWLEGLERTLATRMTSETHGSEAGALLAKAAVEGLLDALDVPDGVKRVVGSLLDWLEDLAGGDGSLATVLASHATRVLAAAAEATTRLGLRAAREALAAVGILGMEVLGSPGANTSAASDGTSYRLEVRPVELQVGLRWSGSVACEPGRLLGKLMGSLLEGVRVPSGPAFGSMPYTTTCEVGLIGVVEVVASVPGPAGAWRTVARWIDGLDLSIAVPLATGWAIDGVGYLPGRTLWGDAVEAAKAIYEAAAGAVGRLAHRVRDAGEWVVAQLRGLAEDLVENALAESAYTMSQSLWRIGDSLVKRKLNDAINGTWKLLEHLIGDETRERFTWSFGLFGAEVTVGLDPFKHQLVVGVAKGAISVELILRRLCEPNPPFCWKPIEGYYWGCFGEAVLDLGDTRAVLELDPLTLEHPSVLTVRAAWGGEGQGPTRELSLEALEASPVQEKAEVRLSQVLGEGSILSLHDVVGLVDVGVVVRGNAVGGLNMSSLVVKAFKDAWFASVTGYRVEELVDMAHPGPDAGLFLEVLFRELYFSLLERSSSVLSELEAFVEVDPPAPGWPRVRLALVLTDPLELLLPLQLWVSAALGRLVGAAGSGALAGAGSGLATAVAERVVLRFELSWAVDFPEALRRLAGPASPPELGLVVRGQANLAALGAIAGREWGHWEVLLEVLLRGVPGAALSVVPGMGSPEWPWAEVCLLRVRLRDLEPPRVLISQVLYDAEGTDSDLEYVELVNAGSRVEDLGDFRIEDGSGSYRLRGHRPLPPGCHLLVARNRTAMRATWGVEADAWGMGLQLSNDGDVVRLVAPDGRMVDEVAWEGHVPGWEGLEAAEGQALVRGAGDPRAVAPDAWYVGEPCPQRSAWW